MIRVIIILFFFSPALNIAQDIDSLYNRVNSSSGEEYIEALINLSHYHLTNSPDSVVKYALLAYDESTKIDNDYLVAKSIWLLGCSQRIVKNYDSARHYFELAASLTDDVELQANVQMGLGGLAYGLGELDKSLEYYLSALDLYESTGSQEKLGGVYGNIGLIMKATDQDEKAVTYFKKAILIATETSNMETLLPSLVNISSLFMKQKEFDSAIRYANECYRICTKQGLAFGKGKTLASLTQAHIQNGQLDLAIREAIEGEEIFTELSLPQLALGMQRYRARALFEQGNLKESLLLAEKIEGQMNSEVEVDLEYIYLLLHDIYRALGDYKMALVYHEKFYEQQKKFLEKAKEESLAELETKYAVEKKEQEVASLVQRNTIQSLRNQRKNIIISALSVFTLLLVILITFYYQRRLEKQKEQTTVHRQQLLRSQLNPHFIFNSLSSIRGFLFSGGDHQPAIQYLGKFAKLMRMVLELSSKEWVTLEEELKALKLYLQIQQIRFNRSFDFYLNVDSKLTAGDLLVPPLTAQPFLENAIEHGLKGIEKDGKIEISCLQTEGRIVFRITDNGIGIDHVEPKENHQSRAIQIFKERLQLISQQMRMKYAFKISDLGSKTGTNGTLVTYELPLLKA